MISYKVRGLLIASAVAWHSVQSAPVQMAWAEPYDPLQLSNTVAEPHDLSIHDQQRNRDIPIRVYLPVPAQPAPVILLSHGLGGSRAACTYASQHWSARGYVVVAMQHVGSDESVWQRIPARERMATLRRAASASNSLARFGDVRFVLDTLQQWNDQAKHSFYGRFDLDHVGMSGHSYGASTTQGVSGQWAPVVGHQFNDSRIDAAVMFSPNRPQRVDPAQAFAEVSIPWMLMTGTRDTSPINDTTVADRRSVYPALPDTINKYELVLHEAEHSAFGDDRGGRLQLRRRNPNHHKVILALSTSFWDAHLRGQESAMAWLHGDGPKEILEPADVWQHNAVTRIPRKQDD